ncbi:MAG: conjugative transposon protein TraJ [Alistipes sp.]|jgi:conjugative transposon TraJ protein|nr:conjugative transposon protein TraJ [Alistipes sp.]
MMLAIDFDNLHSILHGIYAEMIGYAEPIMGVAKGIAGLGALFFVAYRVWQQLSRAESIDVFPLLRPFAIGLCIMFFPTIVLGTINGVMSPVVRGTHQMLQTQTLDIKEFSAQKDKLEREAMLRNPEKAYLADKDAFDEKLDELGVFNAIEKVGLHIERTAYNIKRMVQDWFRAWLELLFMAAALVIDTIRTFFLVVLSILGPIAFAISVWDGFHSTLTQWIGRYLSVYLWLPVADIFSSILARIQVLMLRNDIERLSDPAFIPDGSSAIYIIFMIIGIVGYFCVPTVAGWIVQAGGMGQYNRNIGQAAARASGTAGAIAGNIAGRLLGR